MTETDRDKLARYAAEQCTHIAVDSGSAGYGRSEFAPLAFDALHEVLELHKPCPTDTSWCEEDGFTWPCRTVRAITDVLSGEATGK